MLGDVVEVFWGDVEICESLPTVHGNGPATRSPAAGEIDDEVFFANLSGELGETLWQEGAVWREEP